MKDEVMGLKRVWVVLLLAYSAAIPLSIVLSEPLAFLAVLLWVFTPRGRLFTAGRFSPLYGPLLLFVALVLASLAWSVRPGASIGKLHHLLFFGAVFMLPAAFEGDARGAAGGWYIAFCFIGGATLLAIYDAVRVPLAVRGGQDLFSTGNMRDPQFYMVSICLLVAAIAYRGWPRLQALLYPALALNVLGLVLHFKRGVWLACAGAVVLMALVSGRKRWLFTLLCAAGLLLLLPQARHRLGSVRATWTEAEGGRYALWTEAAPQLLCSFPQGMGWHALAHEDLARHAGYVQPKLDHLHNNVLEIAVELGWIGLALWLVLMGMTWALLFRAARRGGGPEDGAGWLALGCLGAFSGLLCNGVVEYNFGDTEILMSYALLMGLAALLSRGRPGREKEAVS